MKIAYFDTEIDPTSHKVLDIGCIVDDGRNFHGSSMVGFTEILKGATFICGHNIIHHDLKYVQESVSTAGIPLSNAIDTLYWSPLLFPDRPYHALLKDDKLQTEEINNPLNDAIKARDLFHDEVTSFYRLQQDLQQIYWLLLRDQLEFAAFFRYLNYQVIESNPEFIIRQFFQANICQHADLQGIIRSHPIELAYALALINCQNRHSITPPWVLKNYRGVERILVQLCGKPCLKGCSYCNQWLDARVGLKRFFNFDDYRLYAGLPLQEQAVNAAIQQRSLLAVFPTGGGKSITFQVPALMSGARVKGLTVVISPLQSLMKDQVDNLEKAGITESVTINGLLDPIERSKSFERVEDGRASLLYISPESLRSKTIERLLLGRNVVRFVIDEAHCFSSWGQDFRVDYLYIADFIKNLQEKKNLEDPIPVSCFTATAKQKVIADICAYFRDKLGLELEVFSSSAARTNLHYKVFEKGDEEAKYNTVRDLVEEKKCPTIIYVSRTLKAYKLAERLTKDGFNAKPYHGKMEAKEKTENQNAFLDGQVQIMIATSAFGMGVDKKDVGMVIHFEISDSLENYVQEAGRAGRDEKIEAECFVLFNEEDLSKHFILLNQTKLNIKEINGVWKAIKFITKNRNKVSNSPLEIARQAGWDDNIDAIETRVTTAISALEESGYLKRGQNMPRVLANSIQSKTAMEAIEKIMASTKFENDRQKMNAARIIRKLFSSKNIKEATGEEAETRIDYISDHLGVVKEDVIRIINLLREEKILGDNKDLTAFIKKGESKNKSLTILQLFSTLERFLLPKLELTEKQFHYKELNELAEREGFQDVSPKRLKTILNFWAIKNWIKQQHHDFSNNLVTVIACHPKDILSQKLDKRLELAQFIVEFLYEKSKSGAEGAEIEEVLIGFSIHELKEGFEKQMSLFQVKCTIEEIEDALFYLSRIAAIKIEGGFMVVYNRISIERLEQNNKVQYKAEDYQKLNQFYENKVQQIHIVGEYAKKMVEDYVGALLFVHDYFQLNYNSFLGKYFPGSRQSEIKRNLTPAKYRQLFDTLSETQRRIIDDKTNQFIVVAAGPGSGKTKVLVHKLASLLLMEDVKHEQLLMLTFSRAAATEFKKRLIELIGNAAHYLDIKTFHSYCFDLLGKVGSLEKSDKILKATIEKIKNDEVEISQITKAVLVIDEAQDMDADEAALIHVLLEKNPEMRVIAVGDDDQNIYGFRGADSRYFQAFITDRNAVKYELVTNYRSKSNLVAFANDFVRTIPKRLKETPILPKQEDFGVIRLFRYRSKHLISAVVSDLMETDLSGTTCVLTKTNDEAVQISGLLHRNNIPVRLIQSSDEIHLSNLVEIRFFLGELNLVEEVSIIHDEVWGKAKKELISKFQTSSMLEMVLGLIKEFESIHTKRKYKTDFQEFVRESKMEDFLKASGETIFVSTIHKAKGKEFDNVFLLLEDFNSNSDEAKRQLYVALTRAKKHISIHTNMSCFDRPSEVRINRIEVEASQSPPSQIAKLCGYKEVNLGYFPYVYHRIENLKSGDKLIINGEGLADIRNQLILKFSKNFSLEMDRYKKLGYVPVEAKVHFVAFWKNVETGIETKIVLPEIVLERKKDDSVQF
jgi:ATP-dependent DNA helicase RecQ